MNSALMFSKASDEWTTPDAFFAELHREFKFTLDAAASRDNCKVPNYRGPDHVWPECRNGLVFDWNGVVWLNPPYSKCREFIAKAAEEAHAGHCTAVCLVPSRTDTRWWHEHVWDTERHRPRPNVEVRFVRGRLKFGNTGKPENSAPFPSVVIVFRANL